MADELSKPSGETAPGPTGGPVKKIAQIKMSKWVIYGDSNSLYAKTPKGDKLKILLVDPSGIVETISPNSINEDSSTSSSSSSSNNSSGSSSSSSSSSGSSTTTVLNSTSSGTSGSSGGTAVASVASSTPDIASSTPDIASSTPDISPASISSSTTSISDVAPSSTNSSTSFIANITKGRFFDQITETEYSSENQNGKSSADEFLGREMDDDEWDNLLAATYAESSHDETEQAWIMGTILNRSRHAGLNVIEVISQPNQFKSVTQVSGKFIDGPPESIENILNYVALTKLKTVSKNNYYYSSIATYGKINSFKNGVFGTQIGNIFVYPGARWP